MKASRQSKEVKDSHPMDGNQDAKYNFPHNSRICVVSQEPLTSKQIVHTFAQYGKIEHCAIYKEKGQRKHKQALVKFSLASSAALAVDEMNDKTLPSYNFPIKVDIYYPKGRKKAYTKQPEDSPPRSRLFVVCPKEMKESALHNYFKKMEGIEYTKVISDKVTGESKGFAFVKFNNAVSAAIAMEMVEAETYIDGMKVKALIADPKSKPILSPSSGHLNFFPHLANENMNVGNFPVSPLPVSPYLHYGMPSYPPPYYSCPVMPHLIVTVLPSCTEEQIQNLFSRFLGFEHYCSLTTDLTSSPSWEYGRVVFHTVEQASSALATIHGEQGINQEILDCQWDYGPMYVPPPVPMSVAFSARGDVSFASLSKIFAAFGPFRVLCKENENEKCKGIVEFIDPLSGWYASTNLNQQEIDGNVISFQFLYPQTQQPSQIFC